MDNKSLDTMLDRDTSEWRSLMAALDARTGGSLHAAGSPDWESRDVYAHLARWMNHSTDDLEATLASRSRPRVEGSDDEINARWQSADSELSLPEARSRAIAAFERRERAIRAIPPESWSALVEAIAGADGADHYVAHRDAIVA